MSRTLQKGAVALTVICLSSAGVAQAGDYTSWSKDKGAYAYSTGTHHALAIADKKGDDNFVFANYTRNGWSGVRRIENGNGVGTTVTSSSEPKNPVASLRACTNYTLSPDDCGPWSGGA